MSTSSSSSTAFTGSSQFAADLAQVVSRTVSIASLPITDLNNTLSSFQSRSSALTSLDGKVSTVQNAVANLQTVLNNGLLSATSSVTGMVSPTVQASAAAGIYTVEVDNLGSYSNALSTAGTTAVTDPSKQGLSSSSSFALTVGGVSTTIRPAGTTLNDLVDAINSQWNGAVQATVVNVGGSSAPDYRLSFQATKLGSDAIQLSDGSKDLISSSTTGSLASYKVNGIATAVTSDSRTITLAPGLQVQLLPTATVGSSTTITVAPDASSVQSAINTFASAYNAVVDEVNKNHGKNGGALQGDTVLNTVSSVLQKSGLYSNGSNSLAAFGVTLDSAGHLSVDASQFSSVSKTHFSGLVSLLGATGNSGFLNDASSALSGLEDATNGVLKLQETQVTSQIKKLQTKITDKQSQVDQLQTNLQAQMAKADATISSLEQQVSYLTSLFTTQRNLNARGY